MSMCSNLDKHWVKVGGLIGAFFLLISMTGCSPRHVVVNGGETVTVTKTELDRLYQDNELLLQRLEECQKR